jgi:uncharacterized protein DUF3352
MRRLLAILIVLPALVVGCGGGGGNAGSPLDEALGYLPGNAPFVVAVDTNLQGDQYKALSKLSGKFPFGAQIQQLLKRSVEQGGTSFDKDLKPLLGNPFVVGATDARSFVGSGETQGFVGAIQAKDGSKLKDLVERQKPKQVGEQDGAKIYEDSSSGDQFAIKDDVLVVAGNKQELERALSRRKGDNKLSEDDFKSALEGLPSSALVRSYFDVGGLIAADPSAKQATQVKWVGALRKLGLTARAEANAITIDFNQHTDGSLGAKDLPLASGDQAPAVIQHDNELNVGLRNPGQIVNFALGAGRALEGASVEAGKRQVEKQLGISIQRDLLDQLSGDLSANIALDGAFGVRAELKDPAAFKKTLAKISDALPSIAESIGGSGVALSKPKGGEGLYELAQSNGQSILFGVSNKVLVVTNDAARARRLASESPGSVPGTQGSVVISADAEKLADTALKQLGPQLGIGGALGGQLFTGPLGKLTGSVSSSAGGLKGALKLGID